MKRDMIAGSPEADEAIRAIKSGQAGKVIFEIA